jgi:hypothetical protein
MVGLRLRVVGLEVLEGFTVLALILVLTVLGAACGFLAAWSAVAICCMSISSSGAE